jgi:hypothetical protein
VMSAEQPRGARTAAVPACVGSAVRTLQPRTHIRHGGDGDQTCECWMRDGWRRGDANARRKRLGVEIRRELGIGEVHASQHEWSCGAVRREKLKIVFDDKMESRAPTI